MNGPTQERGELQDNINAGFQRKPCQFRAWRGIITYILNTYGGSKQEKPLRFLCCDTLFPSGDGAGTHVRRYHGITITKKKIETHCRVRFQKIPEVCSDKEVIGYQ